VIIPVNTYVIAFGANLDQPVDTLKGAYIKLAMLWKVVGASSLYRTAPVGGVEQGDFTNAVAVFETELSPTEVLDELHRVENEFGRTREIRWGPRTLDLDIIAAWCDGEPVTMDTTDLTIPHPRAFERSFVTVPWNGISLPSKFRELPGHGSIDQLQSTCDSLTAIPERLDA